MAKNKDVKGYVIDKSVKIAGTNYDRRRKVTKSMRHRMEQMYESGKSYAYIANHFDVCPSTVRYNLDEAFKKETNLKRMKYATNFPPTNENMKERIEYKKKLLKDKNFRRATGTPALI